MVGKKFHWADFELWWCKTWPLSERKWYKNIWCYLRIFFFFLRRVCAGEVPWTFCRWQKMRGSVERGQGILSSGFWVLLGWRVRFWVRQKFLVLLKEFFWVVKKFRMAKLPWTVCSPQRIRHTLQRSHKDPSSRFLFFDLQSLTLKCGRPLSCYLRKKFPVRKVVSSYRQKSCCPGKLPWAFCSWQKIRHTVEGRQKILSSGFWDSGVQSSTLK
jgi:hypothetical protein